MSIVVVAVEELRALIAVDTACTSPGGPAGAEIRKMHLLPHANCVIAAVGAVMVGDAAFEWASRPGVGVGFDLIAHGMPAALDRILEDSLRDCAPDSQRASLLSVGNQIVLVGWSAEENRMRCIAFVQEAGSGFRACERRGQFVHPLDPDSCFQQARTVDEIAERAEAAIAYGKAVNSGVGYGGRLVLCELRRDSITTTVRSCTI